MPVNTSSTGASYGKSSDPLCPLGFHPQVRWPTRCKRCFRDYKEHSDASDRRKYGDSLESASSSSSAGDWNSNLRTGFTKSKSLDVSSEMPEWRKRMLARQEQREAALASDDASSSAALMKPLLGRSQSVQPEKYSRSHLFLSSSGTPEPKTEVAPKKTSPVVSVETNKPQASSYTAATAVSSAVASTPTTAAATTASSTDSWSSNTANSWMSWKTSSTSAETKKIPSPVPEVVKKSEESTGVPSWKRVDKPKKEPSAPAKPVASVPPKKIPAWQKAIREKTTTSKPEEKPRPLSPVMISPPPASVTNASSPDFRSTKVNEELLKAKAKIRDFEGTVSSMEKDKKSHLIKIRDLEEKLNQRPVQSETKKIISELKTKYDYIEKKCSLLERENDKLQSNVATLEGELEEVQDNFREDEADEYRHIKRELELASKNCRVLQFKLKKVEKLNHELEKDKVGLEGSLRSGDRVQSLESELEEKNALLKRLEISRRSHGPDASKVEEQLLKDLKDSIERENDLKEQLGMAEEEAVTLRRQLSSADDENESLSSQVKRLSNKAYGSGKSSRISEENLGEIKLQLEVSEQENSSLRRKVDNLLSENLSLGKQLKESSRPSGRREDVKELKASHAEKEKECSRQISALEAKIVDLEKRPGREEMERRLGTMRDKADQTQREVIAAEREKRRFEEEKSRALANAAKYESEAKELRREVRELKGESEDAKRKNRDNLLQTQEGVKAFKEQISSLKSELGEERGKVRDVRELFESKISQLEEEMEKLSLSKEESGKRIKDLEEKWAKSKRINVQRKEKIDALEKQLQNGPLSKRSEAAATNSEDFKELKAKYDLMEEQLVLAKACLQTEKEDIEREAAALREDLSNADRDYKAFQATTRAREQEWLTERKELIRKSNNSTTSSAPPKTSNWEVERDRFKHIIEDRDSQISQLRSEADMSRSQLLSLKKETDDLKFKLNDYEKMSKFQKVVSNDSGLCDELRRRVEELSSQLNTEGREHKSELNSVILQHDAKMDVFQEELVSLKGACSKVRRERDSLKGMLEAIQKSRSGGSGGSSSSGEVEEYKSKVSDLSVQVQILEDELSEARMEASKASAKITSAKSSYEIQVAELSSRINELEESSLIDSGRARIAGTRTKMELAWQKERDGMKKLVNELNTMARDLKSTLLDMEKEREAERLESKRKIEGMRKAFEGENEDTKKQITDLQYDLLELRDAHAKLRTTNEKLRRDRGKIEKEAEQFKSLLKEKSKAESGEDKKIQRLSKDVDDFLQSIPGLLSSKGCNLDTEIAKTEFNSALSRIQDSTRELSALNARRQTESAAKNLLKSDRRRLRSVPIAESSEDLGGQLPDSTRGSRESISSSVSIPLPIPVRTRSVLGDISSSSKDYSIRRLERETSMDRISTGSRDSSFSTQSEWIRGEKSKKKKSSSLIGKLKKLTKSRISSDDPYGSGSDISLGGSAMSINSNLSTNTNSRTAFLRAQEAKKAAASGSNSSLRHSTRSSNPAEANLAYEKYFPPRNRHH